VIKRVFKNLGVFTGEVSAASTALERDGYAMIPAVFDADACSQLRSEIDAVFATTDPERSRSDAEEFRYEMLNRSGACQAALAHSRILEVIEPLLGEDCHVIANTAWRNPPEFAGGPWHCDAGPHVPRPEGVEWDDRIPYPIFAIGAHLYLEDCDLADGPTAVVPGSHRSGRLAPFDRLWDDELSYDGRPPATLTAHAGDVALFVSECWHRGLPANGGTGRYFLQVHYGRRDLAQRIRTTDVVNHLSDEAIARAATEREQTLIGLHAPMFYDG
jgi:ectoine hydroxylase-related dioxygenase (phytanoyl-CoA dioxygenase family)